jgi:HSP20 family protein
MAGLVPWKKKKSEPAGNGGTLAPYRSFPTFLRRMQSEFDELFDHFAKFWPAPFEGFEKGWNWGLDVEDKEDSVVVKAEAPGFEAKDFDLRVSGDRLILRATKKAETKEKEGEYQQECECFESMTLPSGIDTDKVDARYHNGVLTVTIPKTKEGKAKRVTVKAD